MQLWSCVFKVAIVDALIRILGFTLKSMVLILHPAQPEENHRRRSQVFCSLLQIISPQLLAMFGAAKLFSYTFVPASIVSTS